MAPRISVCDSPCDIRVLIHEHLGKRSLLCRKASVMNADLAQHGLSAIAAPGIEKMAALVVGESNCEVTCHGASHDSAGLR